MKFSTILGLAAASAAPAASEDMVIDKLTLDSIHNHTIDYVYFELSGKNSGKNATGLICDVSNLVYPEPTHATQCGNSKYYFQLLPGTDGHQYRLSILHDDDGLVLGSANVPTRCIRVRYGTLCGQKRDPVSISLV
ncbi:hypothetical protein C2857_000932 [Epichloe festucae Fl1]|uniref:AA1-like domain-containing protein n=1 Tax=Epichloe festucae (strain Fl1) TaxID=877507 RepID=A0A7S9KU55_EPIFF|nr:hypothetical protein C2857_000932 [Epichloe festucae Fl1]